MFEFQEHFLATFWKNLYNIEYLYHAQLSKNSREAIRCVGRVSH